MRKRFPGGAGDSISIRVGGQVGGNVVAGHGNVVGHPPEAGSPARSDRPDLAGVFRVIVVVDVAGSGRLSSREQRGMRRALFRIVRAAATTLTPDWDDLDPTDRGDGIRLVIAPEQAAPARVLDEFVPRVARGLREHAETTGPAGAIRLRIAVHFGFLDLVAGQWSGQPLVHAVRLVDSPAVKRILAGNPDAHLAAVLSDDLYRGVVRPGHTGTGPDGYQQVRVAVKETRDIAWARPVHG